MRRPPFTVLAGVCVLAVWAASADAATRTWNGSSGSLWSTAGNWTPSGAPAAGDDLVFPASSVTSFTPMNDFSAGSSFASMTISGSGYTISGNSIVLTGGLATSPSSGGNTIQLGVSFSASQTLSVSFVSTSLTMTGPVFLNTGAVVTVSGSGDTFISGVVSGAGHLAKSGVGRLTLSNANTYTGFTQVNAGHLRIQNPAALGATTAVGTTVAAGAVLEVDPGMAGFVGTIDEPLFLNGAGIGQSGALDLLSGTGAVWAGTVSLATASTISVTAPGPIMGVDPILNINGVISGSGDLTLVAPTGRVRFINANTYTGATTVQSGVLEAVNAAALGSTSQGTSVQNGGSLILFSSILGEPLVLNGTGWNDGGALSSFAGSITWSGNVRVDSDTVITSLNGSTLTLSGVVSDSGSGLFLGYYSIGAPGTLVLTGTNTYSKTDVGTGTVRIDGSQPGNAVYLDDGAPIPGVVGGSGTVASIHGVNTGSVSPGASPGILTTTGPFSMQAGTTFKVELNGVGPGFGYDQVKAGGLVTLGNPTLQVVLGFSPAPGTLFRIIDNTSAGAVSGTFNSLPESAYFAASGQEFQITYVGGTGNDVVLKAIALAKTTISPAGPSDLCSNGNMVLLTAQAPTGGSGVYTGYQWYKDGGFLSGATGTMYQATAPGSYTVRVTDSTGLTGPDSPASVVNQDGTAPSVTPPGAATTTQTLCI